MISPKEERRFDALVEEAIEDLPDQVRDWLEEVPIVVINRPTSDMLRDLGIGPRDEEEITGLCGLHTGVALTERSVERGDLPSVIHIFREGIINLAGGWDQPDADDEVYAEIRITLLHEIGHHFGLDEDDLEQLGYG